MDSFYEQAEAFHDNTEAKSGTCTLAFNRVKSRLAGKLRETATRFPGGEPDFQNTEWTKLMSQGQAWMYSAADQIEHLDSDKLKRDLETKVRNNPGKTILIAAAAGLVLGAAIRRR